MIHNTLHTKWLHNMYLCIDTTTSEAGITLTGHERLPINPHHASEDILAKIDELIQKANIQLSDLKGIFVIKGPGSFTGLRVGIAVANQFAHQLNIPIIGLRTDEWWSYRTDEKDFIYLQSMNKNEIYISKFKTPATAGRQNSKFKIESDIIPLEELSGKKLWLGQLSDEHRQKLPSDFKEINNLRSSEETWENIIQNTKIQSQKTYDLIEPYYGKEPTITKSKRRLSI